MSRDLLLSNEYMDQLEGLRDHELRSEVAEVLDTAADQLSRRLWQLRFREVETTEDGNTIYAYDATPFSVLIMRCRGKFIVLQVLKLTFQDVLLLDTPVDVTKNPCGDIPL